MRQRWLCLHSLGRQQLPVHAAQPVKLWTGHTRAVHLGPLGRSTGGCGSLRTPLLAGVNEVAAPCGDGAAVLMNLSGMRPVCTRTVGYPLPSIYCLESWTYERNPRKIQNLN